MAVTQDKGLPLVPAGGGLEFADLPELGALLDRLHAMQQDPVAPDPHAPLIAELVMLRGKLTSLADYQTFITRPSRTGPGPKVCPCCARPY